MNSIVVRPILHHGLTTIIFISLLARPGSADSPGRSDSDPDTLYNQQKFSPSMGVIIIVLIAALFFMGFFSIYIRHCAGGGSTSAGGASRRGRIGSVARSVRGPRGLDRTVVESFPTFTYSAVKKLKIGKGVLECAVCLTEFDDDDTLRLIPKCDHVFHPDCIDEWLVGHTTCPVCRSNLADGGALLHASPEIDGNDAMVGPINECENPNNGDNENSISEERESMEQPLQGMNGMRRSISIGRPRWFGKFTRSFSTGHVGVKQWDRFTLRLPEEVRKQLMSGNLERSTSLVVLPREASSRRGYRTGFGEGTSRTIRFGSVRVDRGAPSDRWVFSLVPPFFSRVPSLRSPKDAMDSRQGSVHVDSARLPV